jgi:hypothetical protein
VLAHGTHEQAEHVVLALGGARLERDDVAAPVVEQRVDAQRLPLRTAGEHRAMADIAVPQRAGVRGLPASAFESLARAAQRDAVEPALGEQPPHGGGAHRALAHAALAYERRENQLRGRARVLAPHVADELLLQFIKRLGAARVLARLRPQRGEAVLAEAVVPALQRRHAEVPRALGSGRTHLLPRQLPHRAAQLSARQLAVHHRADDLAAEEGNLFAVVLRDELVHGGLLPAAASIAVSREALPSHPPAPLRACPTRWARIAQQLRADGHQLTWRAPAKA